MYFSNSQDFQSLQATEKNNANGINAKTLADLLIRDGCKVSRNGENYLTTCPAHNDNTPSLSLKDADGGIAVNCFADCDARDVLAAIEAETGYDIRRHPHLKSVSATSHKSQSEKVVATYAYRDADHRLLYQVERLESPGGKKSFRQSHPDSDGQPIYKMDGVERVLYNLPSVTQAIQQGQPIFFVEGEKCANALIDRGLCATTSAGGSNGWKPPWSATYAASLKGGQIIILPDNDEPGRKYALAVAMSLRRLKIPCRLLPLPDLPEGGDVVDWLAEDEANTVKLLSTLAGYARLFKRPKTEEAREALFQPTQEVRLRTMHEIERRERAWLWENLIPKRELTIFAGPGGIGKSTAMCAIAATVSIGGKLPDDTGVPTQTVEPGDVLILSGEDSPEETIRPRLEQCGADLSRIHILDGFRDYDPYADDDDLSEVEPFTLEDIERLEPVMSQVQPALVILDPIQSFIGSGRDMNRGNEMRPLLRKLAGMAAQFNCAIVGVAHPPKASQLKAMYAVAGSHEFSSAARSVLVVAQDPESRDHSIIAPAKANFAGLGSSIRFYRGEGEFGWAGASPLAADDLLGPERGFKGVEIARAQTWLHKFLTERGGQAPLNEIQSHAKDEEISDTTLYRCRDRLYIRAETVNGIRFWKLPTMGIPEEGDSNTDKKLKKLKKSEKTEKLRKSEKRAFLDLTNYNSDSYLSETDSNDGTSSEIEETKFSTFSTLQPDRAFSTESREFGHNCPEMGIEGDDDDDVPVERF